MRHVPCLPVKILPRGPSRTPLVTPVERYARYRAPAENGQTLVAPPWDELPTLAAQASEWRRSVDVRLGGLPLADFAAAARRQLLADARAYVARYAPEFDANAGPQPAAATDGPLILTGHQPGLVHPGVWLKNFAAARLAAQVGGAALHLIIDGDVCRSTAILAPAGDLEQPRLTPVEFDAPAAPMPWEERPILDAELWTTFPERMHLAAPLVVRPLLDRFWPRVLAGGTAERRSGGALARARHQTEIAWGVRNWELPQSRMCQSAAFRTFALALLADLPRFVAAHNDALDDYRRHHKLRNHAHPAPNLRLDGPWVESPFWLWSTADPHRRPAWIRRDGDRLTLADRRELELVLPLDRGGSGAALGVLADAEARGVKLRSRALVTTMYARLVLADLFIHGIGGAKYDEATDDICRRFFAATPPAYAAISGTLRLPLEHPPGGPAEVAALKQQLRDLAYHPERSLHVEVLTPSEREVATAAIAAKRRAVAAARSTTNLAERHAAIVDANRTLLRLLSDGEAAVRRKLENSVRQSRANRVLNSREFAFCLFPSDVLEHFLLPFRA